jgi:hypothetical protein
MTAAVWQRGVSLKNGMGFFTAGPLSLEMFLKYEPYYYSSWCHQVFLEAPKEKIGPLSREISIITAGQHENCLRVHLERSPS